MNQFRAAASFLSLGVVFGAIGPLLVLWNLFFDADPVRVGRYLLAFGVGYGFGSIRIAGDFIGKRLAVACLLLAVGWASLPEWRSAGLFLLGSGSAALLKYVLQQSARGVDEKLVRLGSIAGAGAVCVGYLLDTPQHAPFLLAGFPIALFCLGAEVAAGPVSGRGDQRRLASALVGGLVFVQSGCELGLALWLPVYFIRALGSSPLVATGVESLFLILLLAGRWTAERFIRGFEKRRLIFGSFVTAVAGYLTLSECASIPWACVGLVLIASGLGTVYTVTKAILDERFAFDPALYVRLGLSGIAGMTVFGICLACVDAWFNLRALPMLLLIGSSLVAVMELLLLFERRLMGSTVEAGPLTPGS